MREAEANLAIGLELARQLRERGAVVTLTRTDSTPVSLDDRVELAVRSDAQLLVSVHNNAFGEGANPFRSNGTSTYYFHPFSAPLARALDREIAAATRIPDLGAKRENLALVRPSWMPSTLTESLYMPMPEQEAALKDPAFVRRLAAAHVAGIESFLKNVEF
jgi:N-acetylmuramoyl-L-alanine amidase